MAFNQCVTVKSEDYRPATTATFRMLRNGTEHPSFRTTSRIRAQNLLRMLQGGNDRHVVAMCLGMVGRFRAENPEFARSLIRGARAIRTGVAA